jgi:hypothetical protein
MVHATFDSAEAFTTAFAPHATELQEVGARSYQQPEQLTKQHSSGEQERRFGQNASTVGSSRYR